MKVKSGSGLAVLLIVAGTVMLSFAADSKEEMPGAMLADFEPPASLVRGAAGEKDAQIAPMPAEPLPPATLRSSAMLEDLHSLDIMSQKMEPVEQRGPVPMVEEPGPSEKSKEHD